MIDPYKSPQVKAAQAFIDAAWAEHVHELEHETPDCYCVRCDCGCAGCRANGRGPFVRELVSRARAVIANPTMSYSILPLPMMITEPTRMDDHDSTE